MKILLTTVFLLLGSAAVAAPAISPLQGKTSTPQWQYLGTDPGNPEWFSRYSTTLSSATLASFKTAPANANEINLFATGASVDITYLGTGATRDSNLFLAYAGDGSFNTASFWNPIYASGGTNKLSTYNPVNASNDLFEDRAGCSFAQAKAGNTCTATQLGMNRNITNLHAGEQLVFGLQTLPLVYSGGGSNINLPDTNYFFTGSAANNSDVKGWADDAIHAKVEQVGTNEYLVGFEDTWLGHGSTSDRDYNDMVYLFQGVSTVPEGETSGMLLIGAGLMLAIAIKRRRHL